MMSRIFLILALLISINFSYSQCENIGFELGDFTNWFATASAGPNCPQNTWTGVPPCPLPGPRYVIINDPVPVPISDSCSDFMRTPPGKTTSVQIGNRLVGGEIDEISYVVDVSPSNNFLLYEYAAIMEDPLNIPHSESERPAFYVEIQGYNDTTIDSCNSIYEWANPLDLGLRTCNIVGNVGSNRAFYRPWTRVGVDLRKYQNLPPPQNQVTLRFRSRDCMLCGHFGYGFFYAQCDSLAVSVEYCENNNFATLRAPDGFTYRWEDSSTTQEIVIENPIEGQSFWVDLETRGGCSTRLYTVLKAFRTVADFTSQDTVCANDTVYFQNLSHAEYVASGNNIPIAKNFWKFGDGDSSSLANPKHVYQVPGTYDVTLYVEAEDGCLDSITKEIVIGDIPNADFRIDNVCFGSIAYFRDFSNASSPLASWNWNFGEPSSPSNTSTLRNPNHLYQTPGKYEVNLEVLNIHGCKDVFKDTIEVYKNPIGDFTYEHPCASDSTLFFVNQDSIDGLRQCNWTFGNGFFSNEFNPRNVYSTPGNYQVTLRVIDQNGCSHDMYDTITIVDLVVDFPQVDFCKDEIHTFDFSSNIPVSSFLWDFNDGMNATTSPYSKSYSIPGVYNVKLTAQTIEGCQDSIMKSIKIFELPEANFEANEKYGCELLCVDFQNLSNSFFGLSSVFWNFGDGNTSTDNDPTHCYDDIGLFDVTLSIVSTKGCKDTLIIPSLIQVDAQPIADFEVTPTVLPIYDTRVFLNNTSQNERYIEWYFEDSLGYLGNSIVYKLPDDKVGSFDICLTAFANPKCYDSVCKTVEIYGDLVYVPNTFTPNGDGINDIFKPVTFGLEEKGYRFMVFNRWGDLLYETSEQDKGWDGIHKDQLVKDDVYVWKLKGKVERTQTRIDYYGHVTLLNKATSF